MHEISQQLALIEPDAAVVSSAVPPTKPSFPNKLVFGGIGILGSILLSMMIAALVEHNDKSLRTGPQVEQSLGVINLGLVPHIKRRWWSEPLRTVISRHPQSVYAEAIRAILMQLLRPGVQVVLVTSALPRKARQPPH